MNDSPRQSVGESSVQPANPSTAVGSFSLRRLMTVVLQLAIVFTAIGYWTRDWTTRNSSMLHVLTIGWTAFIGLIYFLRSSRRPCVRHLGGVLLRIRASLLSTIGRILGLLIWPILAVAFILPQFVWLDAAVSERHIPFTANYVLALPCFIVPSVLFIVLTVRLIAPLKDRLVLHEFGFTALIAPGGRTWDQVISSRWRHQQQAAMIELRVAADPGKKLALRFNVPRSRIASVDKVLLQLVGTRHTPFDSVAGRRVRRSPLFRP